MLVFGDSLYDSGNLVTLALFAPEAEEVKFLNAFISKNIY